MFTTSTSSKLEFNPELKKSSPVIKQIENYLLEEYCCTEGVELKSLVLNLNGYRNRVKSIYLKFERKIPIDITSEVDNLISNVIEYTHGLLTDVLPRDLFTDIPRLGCIKKGISAELPKKPIQEILSFDYVVIENPDINNPVYVNYFVKFKEIYNIILNYIRVEAPRLQKEAVKSESVEEKKAVQVVAEPVLEDKKLNAEARTIQPQIINPPGGLAISERLDTSLATELGGGYSTNLFSQSGAQTRTSSITVPLSQSKKM